MSRKKEVEVRMDEKEPIVEVSVSDKAKAFKELIEAYKKQNPKKYEMKKEALEEQLKKIK